MAREYNDISLGDILPDSISGISEIISAAAAIDPELLGAALCINEGILLARINELPEPVLDLLAWQYHVDIYEPLSLPIQHKRSQVEKAILLHRYKGTPWAINQALSNLGYEQIKIVEWWDLGTAPHTFAIKLYPFNEDKMRDAERIIMEYKPVRSHLICLEGTLPIYEELQLQEATQILHNHIPADKYPWIDTVYGSGLLYSEVMNQLYGGNHHYGDIGFSYAMSPFSYLTYGAETKYGDTGAVYGLTAHEVPQYGVFRHTEKMGFEVQNSLTDTVPDMEDGVSVYITRNLLYDNTVLYGTQYQDSEVYYL